MSNIQLEGDRSPVQGSRMSIPKSAICNLVFFVDIVIVATAAAATMGSPTTLFERPILGVVFYVGLVGSSTLLLSWLHDRDDPTQRWPFQLRAYGRIVLYCSFVGALVGEVLPSAYGLLSRFLLLCPLALLVHHAIWTGVIRLLERGGFLEKPSIVLLVLGSAAASGASLLRTRYRILRQFDAGSAQTNAITHDALTFAHRSNACALFVVGDWNPACTNLVEVLTASPVPSYLLPSGSMKRLIGLPSSRIGSAAILEIQRAAFNAAQARIKRLIDIVVATLGLVLASPILIAVAILIKIDSPGPIIYRQTRLGLLGRPFRIFKFRTMNVWKDDLDVTQAKRGDARVTSVGRWLRATSIDELPQLLNIWMGDMSIVGPRPHALAHDTYYSERIQNYLLRQKVRPGLTGWAQVNDHRGETPCLEKMAERVALDLWYVDHWTPALDLAIVLRTVAHMLHPTDVY